MIDIHSHILPGVDDGSSDLTDSILMAELAVEGGTNIIIATPHSHVPGVDSVSHLYQIRDASELFEEEIRKRKIPLRILPGMEISCRDDLSAGIRKGYFPGLGGTDYYLIEFDFYSDKEKCRSYIREVIELGKHPVIAHPERYTCIQKDIAEAERWVSGGCLLQINKGSPFGSYGRKAAKTSMELLKRNLVFCVGSDAHSPYRRTPFMGEIREFLTEEFSSGKAEKLLEENPGEILKLQQV